MLQSLATLIFAAAALSALATIAASIGAEWVNVRHALGLVRQPGATPLPARIRSMPARPVQMLRVRPVVSRRAA